ncbi:MAG TPA: type II secretion system protein GspE, partial [Anaeromyxobacteraceae bacterium]
MSRDLSSALDPSARPAAAPPPGLAGRPIGEILVRAEGLDPARIEEALAAQRGEHAGLRLGEILIRLKAVGEAAVLRALAKDPA